MSGWFLREIAIEGFRGINNDGDAFRLKLKPDKVNSVSAPNGVGKSSIFDAVTYALTGEIPKLESLPAAERGDSYYLNRFHSGPHGTIVMTLAPSAGGDDVTVTVERDVNGVRSVAASGGADGESLLAELNREFVLLDGRTFQEFIDLKPLDRGRSIAGLLGLRRYSDLRQALLAASNTNALNNHFSVAALKTARDAAKIQVMRANANIAEAYKALVGAVPEADPTEAQMLANAQSALTGIDILKPHCEGKPFETIDPNACVEAAKAAEGGEDRQKLTNLLRAETEWQEASAGLPDVTARARLAELAGVRDAALDQTQGDLFRQLYRLSETILSHDDWEDKSICPACDRPGDQSVLTHVQSKIGSFNAVLAASTNLAEDWATSGWSQLAVLEKIAALQGEAKMAAQVEAQATKGELDAVTATALGFWAQTLVGRADAKLREIVEVKTALEKALPPKLTSVVEKVEAARRMQSNLTDRRGAEVIVAQKATELARIARVKTFLDEAVKRFSNAESNAGKRRLAAIEPKCREYFSAIMHEDVTPALTKKAGSEEISLALAQFWSLENVSAQALLGNSIRARKFRGAGNFWHPHSCSGQIPDCHRKTSATDGGVLR